MTSPRALLLLVACALVALACVERTATERECAAIFDRIVDIELSELGFRDPALSERKRAELRRIYDARLGACVGRPLPAHAMACVARAQSTEQLSHECLHRRGAR